MLPRTPLDWNGYMQKSTLSLVHQNLSMMKIWKT